jgi:AhpC/TSA antioxidant enzyme
LSQLGARQEEISAAGLQVAAIGLGEPKHAQRYCPKLAPSVLCLSTISTDPYQVWGIDKAPVTELLNPEVLLKGTQVAAQGFVPNVPTGDVSQRPATFILDKQGLVQFTYYSRHAADEPDINELLTIAARLKTAS